MSRFFPRAAYAEDQPYARTLLWSHVLFRGFQTGSFLGLGAATAQTSYQLFRRPEVQRTIFSTTLRSTGIGAVVGTVLIVPVTFVRMNGREEIEWQDRAWRLLENKGQVEVDDWSLPGSLAGGLAATTLRSRGTGALRTIGSAGLGSMLGVMGYLTWRHAIYGGQRKRRE